LTYQFPAFATEMRNTKHILDVKPTKIKHIISVEMKQQSKCERTNETRCYRPWTKINLKAREKSPVSKNILKSLGRFFIVILQHKVLLHSIAFHWIMDWAYTKSSTVRPGFLPYHAYPT